MAENSTVPQEIKEYSSKDMAVYPTHRITVRECDGMRSSKTFSVNSRGLTSKQMYQELETFNATVLINRLRSDLILSSQNNKKKTHYVVILPHIKTPTDREITLYLHYPHYSCLDIAKEIQKFFWRGKLSVQ